MTAKERMIAALPRHDQPFKVKDIIDSVYPNSWNSDREGRWFNRGSATLGRMLRRTEGVIELPNEKAFFISSKLLRELKEADVAKGDDPSYICNDCSKVIDQEESDMFNGQCEECGGFGD